MINDPVIFHLQHMKEAEDFDFWSSLAEKTGGPILELGCGTGRLLIPLMEMGYHIIGLDIDFQALTYMKDSLNDELIDRAIVFQSSMDRFQLNQGFSLIFLACNTLSTLTSDTRLNTYKRIYSHLSPGGIFSASFPNPAYLQQLPVQGDMELEETLLHPVSGHPIQVSSGWVRSINSVIFRWHYDQLFPDGQVVRTTIETEHVLTSLDEYIAELKSEKLNPIQICGDYNFSDYETNSSYVIIIARKEV